MNLLSTGNDLRALAYIRAAKDLCQSEVLRRGDLLESGIVGFIDLDTNGCLATVTQLPDEDALRGLVSRVRKFLLKQDPSFFSAVRNVAVASVKGRHDADPVLHLLAELKSKWAASDKLREESPRFAYFSDALPNTFISVTPDVALQAWLYAEIFHASDPKLVAQWEEVNAMRGVADIYRAYALSAIVGYIPLVLALAFVLQEIRLGKVPDQDEINSFKVSWQDDWGVKVPPPDHFLGRLVNPPMRRATALRLLRGESVTFDDIMQDLASQGSISSPELESKSEK